MVKAILEGITYGLFLAILVGPLIMTLVNTAIKYGYKKGIAVASGIWLSDFIIILVLFNLSKEFNTLLTEDVLRYLSIMASITFIGVGLIYVFRNKSVHESKLSLPNTYFWQMIKGFLINTINPFTFVFWSTLFAKQLVLQKHNTDFSAAFFTTIMIVIVLTDSLKVVLAHKISFVLKSHIVAYLQYFSGVIFIASGIYIMFKFFF